MNSLKKIVEWAAGDLSDWEGDLVCRILEGKELDAENFCQVKANFFNKFGLKCDLESQFKKPQVENANTLVPGAINEVFLCNIRKVENVNAIHNNSVLPFGHQGLTLLYGENGSGKSGFARVLKNACFAKYVEPELLKNVYKAGTGPQSADIELIENGKRTRWTWSPGSSHPALQRINVFDSESGKVLLEKTNEVTYKPRGVEIFDAIPLVIDQIRQAVANESRAVELPNLIGIENQKDTKTWLEAVNHGTTDAQIVGGTAWTEDDINEFEKLTRSIDEFAKGIGDKNLSKAVALLETRVPRAVGKLMKLLEVLSAKKNEDLVGLSKKISASKVAYDLALASFDNNDPLDGVHSAAWRLLFDAAKAYSETQAYPNAVFPNTDDDAACVLCMQPLDGSAKARLLKFNSYVTDKSKTLYENAVKDEADAKQTINSLTPVEQETYEPMCAELLELIGSDCGLADAFKVVKQRHELLTRAEHETTVYPTIQIDAIEIGEAISSALKEKIEKLRIASTAEQNAKDIKACDQLKFKKALHACRDNLTTYRDGLMYNKVVGDALAAIKSTKARFSAKAKSLVSELITPEFIENFDAELRFFNVNLTVMISAVVKEMGTSHSFTVGAKRPDKVLSEGEQKVISIAAFFAELKTFKNEAPIVLDDPVSSLDHVFREKIAERVAIEGLNRQIIIFTHDLSLIMEIEGKCMELGLTLGKSPCLSTFTIRRNGKDAGHCLTQAPWRGMTTAQRAQMLEVDLHKVKALYETDQASYTRECALIYCLIREAWEGLIEQDLFHQIVSRGRNSVQTLRLDELVIESTDAGVVGMNMSRASTWMFGHEKSRSLAEGRPPPAEVLKDIEELRTFSKKVIGRRKTAKEGAKAQVAPAVCEIG